jgi:putative transposase
LESLSQTQLRYPFRLFGYCLMPNHFHLLMRTDPGISISRVLQSLTIAHTWHYHKRYRAVGHVWQGRFKSPAVESDEHLWTVLRYIEANPLRARVVADPDDYRWSSYPAHALGRSDPLLSKFPDWQKLGGDEAVRRARWREKVLAGLSDTELAAVRRSLGSGRPFGTPSWVEATQERLGLPAKRRPRGRPRKNPLPAE